MSDIWKDPSVKARLKQGKDYIKQLILERDEAIARADAAIKDANRRDQKWMDGIKECLGVKLDYVDFFTGDCASKALREWAKEVKERAVKGYIKTEELRPTVTLLKSVGAELDRLEKLLKPSITPP